MAGTNHWNSKLSTNIQCKKNHHSTFLIFQKLCQNINKKTISLAYFGPLEANYIQFIRLQFITLFLPDSNNWFFVCSVSYIPIFVYYFLILCFYFHLPCHLLLATRHILQVTMFDSTLSQPAHNTTEIRNTSQSTTKEKVLR